MFKKSRENLHSESHLSPRPSDRPTGGPQICIFHEGRPVSKIEAPRVPYFLTGRVGSNLRWQKTHDKMIVQMLKCSKSHEKTSILRDPGIKSGIKSAAQAPPN